MPTAINSQAFWQFSLDIYRHPQVANTLLEWQDTDDKNVNLCLFLLYLNTLNIQLSAHQLTQLIAALTPFNRQFTTPLRTLRAQLKKQHFTLPHYETMRAQMLATELSFEQQEQHLLVEAYHQFLTHHHAQPDNLALYISDRALAKKPDLNQTLHQLIHSTE